MCITLGRPLSQSFLLSTDCVSLVRLVTSFNADGVDVASSCRRLTLAAASTGGGRDEGGSPTVPHLIDRLAVPLHADGVNVVSSNCLTPAAAPTGGGHDEDK